MRITILTAILLEAARLVAAAAPAAVPEPPAEVLQVTEDAPDSNGTMSLDPRRVEYGHGRGRVICGRYANADYHKFIDLVYDMDNKDKKKEWTIGGGQCNRVSCYDTTALYVCNDNKGPITVTGKEIAISFVYVRNYCCRGGGRSSSKDNFISGQQFTPWGWNANAGYGNCRDPVEIRPHMAGGWGVNPGKCLGADLNNVSF